MNIVEPSQYNPAPHSLLEKSRINRESSSSVIIKQDYLLPSPTLPLYESPNTAFAANQIIASSSIDSNDDNFTGYLSKIETKE
jgi:hypothetical protein